MKKSEIDAAARLHVLQECHDLDPKDILNDISVHDFEAGVAWALEVVANSLDFPSDSAPYARKLHALLEIEDV